MEIYESGTVTLDVKLNGETRAVEFSYFVRSDGSVFAQSAPIASARIGQGTKLHRCQIGASILEEKDRRFFQPSRIVRDDQGREWCISMVDVILNRYATIIGWADVKPPTSQHIMERFQS